MFSAAEGAGRSAGRVTARRLQQSGPAGALWWLRKALLTYPCRNKHLFARIGISEDYLHQQTSHALPENGLFFCFATYCNRLPADFLLENIFKRSYINLHLEYKLAVLHR